MSEERKTIIVTGASSGFGEIASQALADAGHVVYAGMRDTDGHNSLAAAEARSYAATNAVCLEAIEMDVSSHESVDHAVGQVLGKRERIDVVVHNAGHTVLGPHEAFKPYPHNHQHSKVKKGIL
jgi:NAD(P)-dependent dehydrogenase (short-subunit alcohol dehydrogenase family)